MKTSDCRSADAAAVPPDLRKHVNYIHGMVLGVDDLIQEFAYHQNQREWLARDAIGYGTLNGLEVTFRKDLKVSVARGTALSPRGQLIRVAPEQCAGINDWLDLEKTKQELRNLGLTLSNTEKLTAYVVLCFRDCKVDELPVPGEPCRCEDQAMAPSRIMDDFRLELRLSPPAQREEGAVRDFVQWLRQINVSNAPAGSGNLQEFLDHLRSAATASSSPLESPFDFLSGSPPQSLVIPAGELCEYLRAALKLWVVELRPRWQAQWAARTGGGCECHGDEQTTGQEPEECLLLAALTVTLRAGRVVDQSDVVVDDGQRPFIVHLRMLQEMLLCGPRCQGGCNDRTLATVFALDDRTLRIWIHHPHLVTFGNDAVQLDLDGGSVTEFTLTQQTQGGSPPGAPLNLFDVDLSASPPVWLRHRQRITLRLDTRLIMEVTSPSRSLAEAISLDGSCYHDLANGIAQVYGTADLPALDDLVDVDAVDGQEGDVLTRQGSRWIASAPANGNGGVTDHGALTGLGDDDHPQYLLTDGTRALAGDLSAGQHKLTDLGMATVDGDAVRFEQAVKDGDVAGGDLKGFYPNPGVKALQGRAVADLAPTHDADVLTWDASQQQWKPKPSAEKLPVWDFVSVTKGPRTNEVPTFDLWFHLNAGTTYTRSNLPELTTFPDDALAIFAEMNQDTSPPRFMGRRQIKSVTRIGRNLFRVLMADTHVDKDLLLRFIFTAKDLSILKDPEAGGEITAAAWMGERPVKWVGHDGANTITAFLRNESVQPSSGYLAVGAGRFRVNGAPVGQVFSGTTATRHPEISSVFIVHFDGYNPENNYVVTGTPLMKIPSEGSSFLMVAGSEFTDKGILVWLRPEVPREGFMVQIHQIL